MSEFREDVMAFNSGDASLVKSIQEDVDRDMPKFAARITRLSIEEDKE